MTPLSCPRFKRLLLTGAAGNLGRVLRPRMKAYCDVLRLSDLAPMDPAGDGEEVVQAPLEDLAAMQSLLKDVDAVLLGDVVQDVAEMLQGLTALPALV